MSDSPEYKAVGGPPQASAKAGTAVLALADPPHEQVATRENLARTRLGTHHRVLRPSDPIATPERPSLVTQRHAFLRKRRRKRMLIALAVLLAFFPPMWPVYLVAWLVWRSRPRQRSMRGVRRGVRALERNQTGVALKQLQEAHFADPSNCDALYWLGLLLSQQGRHQEAAEALTLVAERVPGLPEVERALVDAYIENGDPEGAVYHAQRLLEAAPYSLESLLKLAEAFEAAGQGELAIETLERAPIHRQQLSDELLAIHYRLGRLHEQSGDRDRALHHFKRVYARDISYRDVRERVHRLEANPSV